MSSGYAHTAGLYVAAGWPSVMPVPAGEKHPPPTGFTGAEAWDTSPEQVAAWCASQPNAAVALRMPHGIIGIDVDSYTTGKGVVKRGAATLLEAEARWGMLPPTWTSTARGEGPSRIRFYRVPVARYATVIRPDIEIIQFHHRYAVVWPSQHPEAGTYTWYFPDGRAADRVPSPWEFPELPPAWVQGLGEGAAAPGPAPASYVAGEALLAHLRADERPPCSEMTDALDAAVRELDSPDVGTRHDAVAARVHRIIMAGGYGHAGAGHVLYAITAKWELLTRGENRESEFERMLLGSARKAVTATGGVAPNVDPCTVLGGSAFAGAPPVVPTDDVRARPTDDRPPELQTADPLPQLPPKFADPSWGELIGTHPFTPGDLTDAGLADAMLVRAVPAVRRVANTAQNAKWLLRGVEAWHVAGDLSPRIVKECVQAMPAGDGSLVLKGEEPTPEQRAAKRRAQLMMNSGARAVAGAIRDATSGGRHPLVVDLADLDRNPDILWANGWPWDIRASRETPTVADLNPFTPHLKAAAVAPDRSVSTPRWDAFLATVWPNPAVRAWCLRVLSIAVTGYADATLPVLFGEGGTGKTSVAYFLMQLLGNYAVAPDPAVLGDRGNGFHVYSFKGARLAFIDEAMREGRGAVEILKQLTGGARLTGSLKGQDEVTFEPTHTLVLTSNTAPVVNDGALRRRIRVLPCEGDPAAVRAARQALTGPRWAAEAPGVLAAVMREAAEWLADPDSALIERAPLEVQMHTAGLVAEQDNLSRWVEEECEKYPEGTRARALYTAYRGWCRDGGIPERATLSETVWGRELTRLGIDVEKRRDGKYRPLRLRGATVGLAGWSPNPPGLAGLA